MGQALFKQVDGAGAFGRFFVPLCPDRVPKPVAPGAVAGAAPPVVAAQVGVCTPSGGEMLSAAVTAALQLHEGEVGGALAWIDVCIDFKNMFNSVDRAAALRVLLAASRSGSPEFAALLAFLSMLYNKGSPLGEGSIPSPASGLA